MGFSADLCSFGNCNSLSSKFVPDWLNATEKLTDHEVSGEISSFFVRISSSSEDYDHSVNRRADGSVKIQIKLDVLIHFALHNLGSVLLTLSIYITISLSFSAKLILN